MPKITVDCKGEQIKPLVLPEDWYQVVVEEAPTIKTGKESGKKYMEWKASVKSGRFSGSPIRINTTLDKGDDPTKSKRFMFHQAMAACGILKVDDKYSFDLEDLNGKEFYVRLTIKEESYNGNVFEKNEVKQIAIEPTKAKTEQSTPVFEDADEIPF